MCIYIYIYMTGPNTYSMSTNASHRTACQNRYSIKTFQLMKWVEKNMLGVCGH